MLPEWKELNLHIFLTKHPGLINSLRPFLSPNRMRIVIVSKQEQPQVVLGVSHLLNLVAIGPKHMLHCRLVIYKPTGEGLECSVQVVRLLD